MISVINVLKVSFWILWQNIYRDTKCAVSCCQTGTNADFFNQVLIEEYGAVIRFTVLAIHTTTLWYSVVVSNNNNKIRKKICDLNSTITSMRFPVCADPHAFAFFFSPLFLNLAYSSLFYVSVLSSPERLTLFCCNEPHSRHPLADLALK